jgi:protein dithiol oxidoreductase (disulfide-forming)
MKRREFSALTLTGSASLALSPVARAQGTPVEGTQYVKLSQPVAVANSGKVEVVEFFWYGCPHCNALEPAFDAWARRQPADVAVNRVPVGFTPVHEFHQKLFYALDAMDVLDGLHRKVFHAIHVEHKRINTEADVAAFAKSQGLDADKLVALLKSFSVIGKARQAKQLAEAYRIDGVPAIGVQGRYYTSGPMAGNHERTLAVTDYLIGLIRKSKG